VAAFFGLELAGIAWGRSQPDRVLAFQMFNESSRLTLHLFREVKRGERRALEPLPDGRWQALDGEGKLRSYCWCDRVWTAPLDTLEVSVRARYGIPAQLFRLQAALDDFVLHLPDDHETTALVAQVETRRNGSPGQVLLRAEKP
jgi:hypothetical protein